MRILVISHLFPNTKNRNYGIFMARQLEEISKQGMDIVVIVPMVWAPSILRKFKKWKDYDHNAQLLKFKGLTTYPMSYLRITGNWFYRWNGLSVFLEIPTYLTPEFTTGMRELEDFYLRFENEIVILQFFGFLLNVFILYELRRKILANLKMNYEFVSGRFLRKEMEAS